jgi:hypothetical protein
MKRILSRGVGLAVALTGFVSCFPTEQPKSPYVLGYTIPETIPTSFSPGFSGIDGFTLQESPCDASNVGIDADHGWVPYPLWDPYECVSAPDAVSQDAGSIQMLLDGFFIGSYTDQAANIDLTPKVALTYYEPVFVDSDGDGENDNDGSQGVYAVCHFLMPDDNLNYLSRTVSQISADVGGAISVHASDDLLSPMINVTDFQVWYYYGSAGWWFDYASTEHWFDGYLVDDVFNVVYGSAGPKAIVNGGFDTSGFDNAMGDGVPWCGNVVGTSNPNFF